MLPEDGGQPGGFAGAGIVDPPAVDVARGLVYVGTTATTACPTRSSSASVETSTAFLRI
jgi:hypothetical protein